MNLCCQQDDRRELVRRTAKWNGLDYVEVADDTQLLLRAYFLGKLPPEMAPQKTDSLRGKTISHNSPGYREKKAGLEKFLKIEGGTRIKNIQIKNVTAFAASDPEADDFLEVELDKYGDFSPYTLRLIGVKDIDPRYGHADFNFKINCPSDLDCQPVCQCPPPVLPEPEINYLVKDYASFRQLILDRLALLLPAWSERHVPDLGIVLVELLAYTGDYLSYYQDAVATEAYLDTARKRMSVRRHARLVDYQLHEGCNARAWVCIQTDTDFALDAADVSFITEVSDSALVGKNILHWIDLNPVPAQSYEVFEPLPLDGAAQIQFHAAHSEIHFYTWGQKECCLVRGSSSATLADDWREEQPPAPPAPEQPALKAGGESSRPRKLNLQTGDVLIFEEVIGPITGHPADADPARRHAVRLTSVKPVVDELTKTPVVEIEWAAADALPFPFCISAIGEAPECKYLENISVVRGNVILVDHGKTVGPEDLGVVPMLQTQAVCECADHPGDIQIVPGKFSPQLAQGPLTFAEPFGGEDPSKATWRPAASMLQQNVREALPQARLASLPTKIWEARYDLVGSEPNDAHFVVEMDDDSVAHLRFGDGQLGFRPPAAMSFNAIYRVGNGSGGNVGAEAISRLVLNTTDVSGATISIRNPLPAQGGIDAEPTAEAKLFAPHAFRDPKRIQRAIIADDYALIAERKSNIQRASAALLWTGSWYEADVAIDPLGSEAADAILLADTKKYLHAYRRMGHDLRVLRAHYVPLDLALKICVAPDYQRGHVKAALLDVFGNRFLPGGHPGFFHPDNLTFGEGIFLSKIISTAQAVPGVASVTVTRFQRLFEAPNHEIENGVLPLRVDEIAQLDNDPNWPERGKLEISVCGGR